MCVFLSVYCDVTHCNTHFVHPSDWPPGVCPWRNVRGVPKSRFQAEWLGGSRSMAQVSCLSFSPNCPLGHFSTRSTPDSHSLGVRPLEGSFSSLFIEPPPESRQPFYFHIYNHPRAYLLPFSKSNFIFGIFSSLPLTECMLVCVCGSVNNIHGGRSLDVHLSNTNI